MAAGSGLLIGAGGKSERLPLLDELGRCSCASDEVGRDVQRAELNVSHWESERGRRQRSSLDASPAHHPANVGGKGDAFVGLVLGAAAAAAPEGVSPDDSWGGGETRRSHLGRIHTST